MLPPEVWGDGEPEGVRQRAAERMMDTARAAAQLGVDVVTGFTGSPIWHLLYSFPPNDFSAIERGYEEFAERWGPIIDVFEAEGVRFALEVHPTEIAYDFVTTRKALAAIGDRPGFGINFDPSHLEHQFLDSAAFIDEFGGAHLPRPRQGLEAPARRALVDPRRPRRLRLARAAAGTSSPPATATSTSRRCSARSTAIGYQGPLSIEWEDSGMDRDWGAPDALAFVRRTDFAPSSVAFDAAFTREA